MLRTLLAMSVCVAITASAQNASFTILDENVDDVLAFITNGEGTPAKSSDAFSGSESLEVGATGGDAQRFNDAVPDWSFGITENPSGDNEFRYITFAWKKDGGAGIQIQLHGNPDTWGHRYHGGENVKDWNPSIQAGDLPTSWMDHTRDLFDDWGEFTLTGIAFSSGDGNTGWYDAITLHQDPSSPTAVEAKDKLATAWATLKSR
ncbi:hypothetical protein HN371_21880 [Candidatus Poribacteria bacterium]|jgi:hypothetical protein|nr:hypothetical protein [Candidatus Poribacteria bacterium]MBT5536769.1 hypothetical protein [Candidatus Poribacteria bacterium]MBT7098481.1 hypothetical protein [Candidatus Poribacteria bacterium]MBT7807048.1 hypothetical protein [Candidatus Poribacteria bacterium]